MRVVLAIAALAIVACVRGSNRDAPGTDAGPVPTASPGVSGDAWTDGVLAPESLQAAPRAGGTLVVRIRAEPPSLDRITDADFIQRWIVDRKIYESLAVLDPARAPDYPLKAVLAESWTQSDDGRTLTFRLRCDVTWHDGKPFSGEDVVATVQKILDPKVRSAHLRGYFEDLESIATAPGDAFTVIATYKRRYFLALRFLATLPIYPKHLLDVGGDLLSHPLHRAPIGTGPFRFESWTTADRITLARNENYRGPKAWVDKVVFRIVPDDTVAYQLLRQGEFDVYTALSSTQWAREMPGDERLRAEYQRSRFFQPNYSWIGWNTARPFFSDLRVRRALTQLLDRESLRRAFLLGIDRPATCIFLAGSAACDNTLVPLPYDVAAARALLDSSGWTDADGDGVREKDGVPFRFTFLVTASSQFSQRLAPYMQQQFARAGIGVDVRKVEWSVYTKLLREHDFDACFLSWANSDVVSDPHQVWHSTQKEGGSNYISFANAELDRLIEHARVELDEDVRNADFRAIGQILYDENPYTMLFTRPDLDAIRRRVHGLKPAVGWYDLQDAWLDAPPAQER